MLKFAVYGNQSQPSHRIGAIADFLNYMSEDVGCEVVVEAGFMSYLLSINAGITGFETFERLPDDVTMAISMGGDGTFLSTARSIGRRGTPIVGINTGHLGFLADADIADGRRLLSKITGGEFRVEPRTVLQAEIISDGGEVADVVDSNGFALNEIAVLRHDTASMIDVHTSINGMPLADYRGDGLIVATPTGSTGYNLSVGGPIIEPMAPALSIAPIAPHSLSMRPFVVSDSTVIELTISSRVKSWRLSLDGHWVTLPLTAGVRIRKGDFTVNIVHTTGHTFAATLRSKLLWGASTF